MMESRMQLSSVPSAAARILSAPSTGIAEMQFYRISDQWNGERRDYAGLVRFAWREALRRHDRAWLQWMGPGHEVFVADVSTNYLHRGPLGEKLFRTDFGAYKTTDLAEAKFLLTIATFRSRAVVATSFEADRFVVSGTPGSAKAFFSISTNRTYGSGERARLRIDYQAVDKLDFRVYRKWRPRHSRLWQLRVALTP